MLTFSVPRVQCAKRSPSSPFLRSTVQPAASAASAKRAALLCVATLINSFVSTGATIARCVARAVGPRPLQRAPLLFERWVDLCRFAVRWSEPGTDQPPSCHKVAVFQPANAGKDARRMVALSRVSPKTSGVGPADAPHSAPRQKELETARGMCDTVFSIQKAPPLRRGWQRRGRSERGII